ncbi:hypothetical protein NKH95_10810 [Mesorhizobium sp. M0848]|uniref:hypothetical protein n=1 Tax=Mesorhizobium sp. M0848 TaxID=2957012 RepID=UPI003338101B
MGNSMKEGDRHRRRRRTVEKVEPMRFPPTEELLQQGGVNAAIDDLGRNLGALGRLHRLEHRKAVACGYYLARILQAVPDLWRDFCHRPDWVGKPNRPRLEEPSKAIDHVFRLSCGLDSPVGQKRASKLKFALADAWEANVLPAEIPEWLKQKGGVEKAYKARRARLASEKAGISPVNGPRRAARTDTDAPSLVFSDEYQLARLRRIGKKADVWMLVRQSAADPSKLDVVHVKRSKIGHLRWPLHDNTPL